MTFPDWGWLQQPPYLPKIGISAGLWEMGAKLEQR